MNADDEEKRMNETKRKKKKKEEANRLNEEHLLFGHADKTWSHGNRI